MKRLSVLDWYRVLRTRHQWTVFQALRYALWLARQPVIRTKEKLS